MNAKKRIALLLTLVMLLCAAGCGSGGMVDEGHTFTIAISQEVDTLNPLSAWMSVSDEVLMLVYDPLVRYDEQHNSVPCLAESWEVSDDYLTWTFHLAEGVTWHDGEPFTSHDVKFSYELFVEEDAYMYSSYMDGISDISCPDDYTVVMQTEYTKANMLMNPSPVVPRHIWEELDDPYEYGNDHPIGTGPFEFTSEGEGFIKLSKNENYFMDIPGDIEHIVFVLYENADTAAQALLLGEIDGATGLTAAQIEQMQKAENVDLVLADVPGFSYVAFNTWPESEYEGGNPLLREKAIRHAIEYCMDKEKIASMAYGDAGDIGTTLVNPSTDYHYAPTGDELRSYDPDKAAALLEAAGYRDTDGDGIREAADGTKLSFELITIADNTPEVKTAQMMAAGCKLAGIELRLVTMDSGALGDLVYVGDYEMFIWGWGADSDPPAIMRIFITDEWWNLNETGFSDARYDELYFLQQTLMDEDARIAAVHEALKIAYDNAHYIIYIYDNDIQAIRSDKWTNYRQIPEGEGGIYMNGSAWNYMNIKAVE
jgi:peptide/nickel transport system substrate-binding protein